MRHFVLLIGFAGFLSACGSNTTVSNSGSILPEKASQPAVSSQEHVVPKTNIPTPKTSSPTPAIAVVKPRILLEPEIMVGRSVVEVRDIFGAPTLLRVDNPAEVWQYLASECAMHLFFYPGGGGGQLTVSHISINARKKSTVSELDTKLCFNNYLRDIGAEGAFVASGTS